MRSTPRQLAWWLPLLFVGALLSPASAAYAAPEQASVLILLPGQPGLPAASAIGSGIRAVLLTEWSFRVTIEMEHVDVARFASPEVEARRLRALYGAKYGKQRFGGGAAVMHFDVTARRQAEAAAQLNLGQIAHLDRVAAVGQLASSIAHELNQPLAGILANAQAAKLLLSESQLDLEELRACLADIVSDDRRATEVIRRMRNLLKKTESVRMPLALNDLAANTIRLVANDALLQAVTIDFVPAPALPIAYGDTVQIQQVILNLFTNAIAAAAQRNGETRKVTVWTSAASGPYVELGVHDTGHGIAEVDLGRIFEPFFTTKPDGLGMGLAISRTIVEAHSGRLLVENEPSGGATFRVHLRTDQPGTA